MLFGEAKRVLLEVLAKPMMAGVQGGKSGRGWLETTSLCRSNGERRAVWFEGDVGGIGPAIMWGRPNASLKPTP
jgi:hypothetical protein